MNYGPFDNQFIISYELLELLRWLFENEQETLKQIFKKTLEDGLGEELNRKNLKNNEGIDDLQEIIMDFFALMENLLFESIKEEDIKKTVNKNLIPSLNNIDTTEYDHSTVNSSIEKATAAYLNNPKINPKYALCKELLKRWKPSRKIDLN